MKTTKILIIVFSICLIVIGLLIFTTCWTNETKSLISQYAGIIVTGIGFIIAIYQLKISSNQYFDDLKKKNKDYLDLGIDTKFNDGVHSIKTQVINKSGEDKEIDYSFILITQQDSNIVSQVQELINVKGWDITMTCSNDFNKLKDYIDIPVLVNNSIGIIPLGFYYLENIRIGNENPCYTYSFDSNILGLKKGIYSARFFIYPKIGYHRSTVDSLIIK